MQSKTSQSLRYLTMSAVFCAAVYIATALFPITIPGTTGYIHLGDAFIYLAAAILPTPYACCVGAVGAGLADLFVAPMWVPGTMIIKSLSSLMFTAKKDKLLCKRNLIAVIPAGLLCVSGYYLYEAILYSNFIAPLTGIVFNIAQAAASAIIFNVIGYTFDRLGLKNRIMK